MKKTEIPYQETGYFSKLIIDYLDEKEELNPFYNQNCDIDSFHQLIEKRKQLPLNREILVNVLTQQYKGVDISENTRNNIKNLNNNNCFTVTTGHQLNLFTGPLFFIYKIVSTINLTKELKVKYPDNDFIPVYWMATEDHDFDEVNHFNLLNKRYESTKIQNGAVGNMNLEGIEELLAELKEDLGERDGAEEIIGLFSKFYNSSKTYSEAIRGIVNELFGKYGLVILDGDNSQLKSLMNEEFKNELLEKSNHLLVEESTEQLKSLGYKAQITPREINLFYIKEGLRERIVFEENSFKVLNTNLQFSELEILEELKNHTERFSPNAVFRTMYQEKVLPNLAYIGGGGELAYWFQLKAMFDANNISFPTLVLRNSVLFIDKGSSKRLSKLGLESTDLFNNTDFLINHYLKKSSEIVLDLQQEEKEVISIFDDIVNKAGMIDQSLQASVKAEMQKNIKSLKNIESRLIKAEKKKQEVAVNQIKNLKNKLFPNGSLQERHDNLMSILLFYGEDVIEELMENLKTLDNNFVILSVE